MRLLELQNESDSVQACAAIGRLVGDPNLRGWAAIVADATVAEGLKHSGLAVLKGAKASLAMGSIGQIWSAARSVADGLDSEPARELMRRAAAVESPAAVWKLPRSTLPGGRTLIMGIVNATPDSFSDGGAYDPLQQARRLVDEGADIIDVGGESTRPGAAAVDAREEWRRVAPVVHGIQDIPLSIDTTKPEVARAAVDAGAQIVNLVSGDAAGMPKDAALCVMHTRGTPPDMQRRASYADLHGEILAELEAALEKADLAPERVAIDPGLGFAKTGQHNLTVLRRLRELAQLGHPLLVGASRKAFIGKLTGRPAGERAFGSVAAAVHAAMNGALVVRVHDVAATREALQVADAIRTSIA